MGTDDVMCQVCKEWFGWGYWDEMFKHKHSLFECMCGGKMYEFQIKLKQDVNQDLNEGGKK